MVTVGRVVRPHGHRGEVVVASETDFGDERFRTGAAVYGCRGGVVEPLTVVASREHAGRWVVGLAGVASVEAAEAWRGHELRVPESTLRPLGAGAYYAHQLVGCEVVTEGGRAVGTVRRVDLAVGVPVLVIEGRGEVLVPFVDAICRLVDVDGRRIVIDPPEGLIELNWTTR